MKVELMDCTRVLIDEIADRESTRDTVALTYGMALRSSAETDWPAVNRAIMERWSRSALEYVKRRAWAYAEWRAGHQKQPQRSGSADR